MRIAYADPPYPGQAKLYKDHPDYAGEVDHAELIASLAEYDGWALSTSAVALREILPICPADTRVMAWVKPFAAFKRNITVAYAWEPLLVRPARPARPNRIPGLVMRDWIAEGITMRRGLTGAKPERFCWWLFEVLGLDADDELCDLFPGSQAVTAAHETWKRQMGQGQLGIATDAEEPLWVE